MSDSTESMDEKAQRRAGLIGPPGFPPTDRRKLLCIGAWINFTGTDEQQAQFIRRVEKELRLQFQDAVQAVALIGVTDGETGAIISFGSPNGSH